jgi:hypothetical protein
MLQTLEILVQSFHPILGKRFYLLQEITNLMMKMNKIGLLRQVVRSISNSLNANSA